MTTAREAIFGNPESSHEGFPHGFTAALRKSQVGLAVTADVIGMTIYADAPLRMTLHRLADLL